jgi:sensor domain CHASE-containing protein
MTEDVKKRLSAISSAIIILMFGCLMGGYGLWMHLKVSAVAQDQAAFKQNVEQFAKKVNEEFNKISSKEKKK